MHNTESTWPPSKELIEHLKTEISELQSIGTKASIWCDLNSYKFPVIFDHLKPSDYDKIPDNDPVKHEFVWELMSLVIDEIGYEECLRFWNSCMTVEEFDEWWGLNKGFFKKIEGVDE